MAVDIVTALLASSASSAVAEAIWKVLRQRLQDKGVSDVPATIGSPDEIKRAEAVLVEEPQRFSSAEAHDLTLQSITEAQQTANGIRAERMRQARHTFNAALSLAVIGTLIIFGGIVLLIVRESVAAGALTSGVGAVTEVVAAILFRLNHQTNNRLDDVGRDLSAIETARIAVQLIDKIEDPQKRDDAIREAARDLRAHRTKGAA